MESVEVEVHALGYTSSFQATSRWRTWVALGAPRATGGEYVFSCIGRHGARAAKSQKRLATITTVRLHDPKEIDKTKQTS
ncbi:hypothetical protein PTI98_010266 [Pleurotus ostreatus]|nr:hypothetical protein PTI98_010266 [Pleurotus ostreatus]